MKFTFVALFLLVNVALYSATSTRQNIEQGRDLLKQLKNSGDIGRNIYQTIDLELSTAGAEDQTIVSKVIELLNEVKASVQDQKDGFQDEFDTRNEQCYEGITKLRDEIEAQSERLDDLEDRLPLKQDEVALKSEGVKSLNAELAFYQQELIRVDGVASARKESYEESKEEHDSMIAALEQARRVIRQLIREQQGSFLQSGQKIMAQVNEHFQNSLNSVTKGHNKGLLKVLISMTTGADQDQVSEIIDIIDELIAQVEETSGIEAAAERRRNDRYLADRERLNAGLAGVQALIRDQSADLSTAQLRLSELEQDINNVGQSLKAKQEQLEDRIRACDDQVADLKERIGNYAEIIAILNQVIILMENSSIQGAQAMMSDYYDENPSAKPKEEEEAEQKPEQKPEEKPIQKPIQSGELDQKEEQADSAVKAE